MNFLQILPPSERNWQEKPPHEAIPIAVCGIVELQNGFDKKKPMKGKKQIFT